MLACDPHISSSSSSFATPHLRVLYELLDVSGTCSATNPHTATFAAFSRRFVSATDVGVVNGDRVREFVSKYVASYLSALRALYLPRDYVPCAGDVVANVL